MKAILIILALAFTAQSSDEPYPGQREHKEPPAGWTCMRPPIDLKGDQSHWCSCERHCDGETQWMHNDTTCMVHCHEDHCACPVAGDVKRCMPEGQP